MPLHESHTLDTTAPVEKKPDFAALQAEKERIFKEIEEKSLTLDLGEKINIIGLVSDSSVKDAFELARRLSLPGDAALFALTQFAPVAKHEKFFSQFANVLRDNRSYVNNYLFIDNTLDRIQNPKHEYLIAENRRGLRGGSPPDLVAEIESHYAHYIRNRSLLPPELPEDQRTMAEATAEDHLLSAEAILNESYYTGPVREMLGIDTEDTLEDLSQFPGNRSMKHLDEKYLWALRGNVIDRETLFLLLQELGEVSTNAEMEKILTGPLKKARYAPSKLVFETRKKESEKALVKDIQESLKKRGYKEDDFEVRFNEEKGEYEVVEKGGKGGQESEENTVPVKENFRNYADLHREVAWADGKYLLTNCTILEGGLYQVYRKMRSGKCVIIDEHHNHLSSFNDVSNLQKVGGREVFLSQESGEFLKLVVDTRVVECKDKKIIPERIKGGVVDVGGELYWYGEVVESGTRPKYYIVKNDRIYSQLDLGFYITTDLLAVANKLTYVFSNYDINVEYLTHGLETFGPYKEIKLCKNSKDKLIFYKKEGSTHYLKVDDQTVGLSLYEGEEVKDVIRAGANVVLLVNRISGGGSRVIFPAIDGIQVQSEISIEANVIDFSDIDGKLFFTYGIPGEGSEVYWGGTHAVLDSLDLNDHHPAFFDGHVFLQTKNAIHFLKYNDRACKKIPFEGTVELVKSGDGLFVIESLPDHKRIWKYEGGQFKLNGKEQRDLDLLNAVVKEDRQTIEDYFSVYYPQRTKEEWLSPIESGIKTALTHSRRFVGAVNQTIKDMPELFMDTLRAKNDKPTEYLMKEMFNYMFPEAEARKEAAEAARKEAERKRAAGRGFFGSFGGRKDIEGESGRSETVNYDEGINRLVSVDQSTYYETVNERREVLKLREPLPPTTFITRSIFGNHSESGWTKVNVPLSQEVRDPARETTFEFVDEKSSQTVNLPRIANSKIITERLKGITATNEEIPVQILEENVLGEVRVDKGDEAKRLTYSMAYSEIPKTMAEVPAREYEKFRTQFENSFGDVMTAPIGDLGDELNIFVDGLKGKTPREQVIAIQEFCYEYGYYSMDEKPRDTNKLEERVAIMEGRMDTLKAEHPELASKKYAGICTDFATLTTALLRKAGFVSGIASGFVPEEGDLVVRSDRAHAVSFVLWPNPDNKDGKPDFIIVDGTPSSMTPKIVELEQQASEKGAVLSVDAEKQLVELEHILKSMDPAAIRNLENGKLEQTLNHILYGVKQSHVDIMNRVLNASRYADFDVVEMAKGNLTDQIEFRKFLEEEIYKEKQGTHENRDRKGEELFELMREFAQRFEKDKNVKTREEALDILEKVFDTAEKYLDPIESRSAAAVITYLRARRMR